MGFGPYKLLEVKVDGNALVLHLGDEDGQVLFKPRRLLSYRGTEDARRSAESLKESLVTTRTFNPAVYSPEEWWLSVHRYSPPSVDGESTDTAPVAAVGWCSPTEERVGQALPSPPRPGFAHVFKVYGPPGTGKTTRLLQEIEAALVRGVRPDEIGFFSFTNKATDEAKSRMTHKFPQYEIGQDFPYFQTLHSLAVRSLRTKIVVITEEQATAFDEDVTIERPLMKEGDESSQVVRVKHPVLDASGTARVMKVSLEQHLIAMPETQRWPINKWLGKQRRLWADRFSQSDVRRCLAYADRYEEYKRALRVIDYTDMLERALKGGALPDLKLLLLDEAQDLSPLQWDLARVLISRAECCYVAGDDDQAICEPFGASAKHFVDLPVSSDKEIVLQDSKRVPRAVHDALRPLIDKLSARYPYRKKKDWRPRQDSHHGDVGRFADTGKFLESVVLGRPLGGRSVLLMFTTNETLRKVSDRLKHRGVTHFSANRLIGAGDTPPIRLQTVWGAKGGEADITALIVESEMDRKMLLDDPRLEYVAHTRARHEYHFVDSAPGMTGEVVAAGRPLLAETKSGGKPEAPSRESLEQLQQRFRPSRIRRLA